MHAIDEVAIAEALVDQVGLHQYDVLVIVNHFHNRLARTAASQLTIGLKILGEHQVVDDQRVQEAVVPQVLGREIVRHED